MKRLRSFLEFGAFGVCSLLGERMGFSSRHVRLFFIYTTFLTLGSPVVVYLTIAFVLNLRGYFMSKRNPVWEM